MTHEIGLNAAGVLMTRETRGVYVIHDDNDYSIRQIQDGTTTFNERYTNNDSRAVPVRVAINGEVVNIGAITWPDATDRRKTDTIKLLDTNTGLFYHAPMSQEVALVIEQLHYLDPKMHTTQVHMNHFNMRRIHVGDNLFQLNIQYFNAATTELFTVGPKTEDDLADVFNALMH